MAAGFVPQLPREGRPRAAFFRSGLWLKEPLKAAQPVFSTQPAAVLPGAGFPSLLNCGVVAEM
jgi:hypothetical protein